MYYRPQKASSSERLDERAPGLRTNDRKQLRYSHAQDSQSHNQPVFNKSSYKENSPQFKGTNQLVAPPLPFSQNKTSSRTETHKLRVLDSQLPVQDYPTSQAKPRKSSHLQKQFEELRNKIRAVQNKNEYILEKIHNSRTEGEPYHTTDLVSPVISFGYGLNETPAALNSESASHNRLGPRNQLSEFRTTYSIIDTLGIPAQNCENEQVEFRNPFLNARQSGSLRIYIPPEHNNKRFYRQRQDYQPFNQLQAELAWQRQAREDYEKQIEKLRHKLQGEKYKHECLKNKYKSILDCAKAIFQNEMEKFMGQIEDKMYTIERGSKRLALRVDNASAVSKKLQKVAWERLTEYSSGVTTPSLEKGNVVEQSPVHRLKNVEQLKQLEEFLQSKYQQLRRVKNQEIDGLNVRLKVKEKEIAELKEQISRLKQQRREKEIQYDQKLQEKHQNNTSFARNLNRKLIESPYKRLTGSTVAERFTPRGDTPTKLHQSTEALKNERIKQLSKRIEHQERTIAQKSKTIQKLETDLMHFKDKKAELFKECQSNIEANRENYRSKINELNVSIQEMRNTENAQSREIRRLQEQERTDSQRLLQSQMEISVLKRKMMDMVPISNRATEEAATDTRSLADETEKNQKQNGNKDKSGTNAYIMNEYQRLVHQNLHKQVHINTLEKELKRYEERVKQIQTKFKNNQEGHLREAITPKLSELTRNVEEKIIEEYRQKISDQKKQYQVILGRLETRIGQMTVQNRQLEELISNLKDEKQTLEVTKEHQSVKCKELRKSIEGLESIIGDLQKSVLDKEEEISTLKLEYQTQINAVESEFKMLQEEYIMNLKASEKQRQNLPLKIAEHSGIVKQLQTLRDLKKQNEALKMQIKKQEEETAKMRQITDQKVQQYEERLRDAEAELDKVVIEKIKLSETYRCLQGKVHRLEGGYSGGKGHLDDSLLFSKSEVNPESFGGRLKSQESEEGEKEAMKASLQRSLRVSEENNMKLMTEVNKFFLELENRKMQFNRELAVYEERIAEQESTIKNLEKGLREKEQFELLRRTSISFIHPESSHVLEESEPYLEISQLEGIFQLENSINFEKVRLRRKDQAALMRKTMHYIRGLRKTIEEKNKNIKVLHKRIETMKSTSSLFPGEKWRPWSTEDIDSEEGQSDRDDVVSLKSMGILTKTKEKRHYETKRKFMQLKDEARLILQENDLLQKQIAHLEHEIEQTDEQEDVFLQIKEIYKKEIQSLRQELERKESQYKQQMKRLEGSRQVQTPDNLETVKQLVVKIFLHLSEPRHMGSASRAVEQQLNILTSMLKMEPSIKQKLLLAIAR